MKWKLFLSALALCPAAAFAQTQQQTDNLYAFSRLYGYVRYFHPSDANVVTDWDKFAIYGAREAEKAANRQALLQTLERLFRPIAPSLHIYPTGTPYVFNVKEIMPPDTTGMKVVAWQHNGYGAGTNNQTYRSVRTNSYIKGVVPWQQSDFSTILANLNAKPYRGRLLRYSAAMKAENLEKGTGQLWLRVDREGRKTGFFDNMDNRPLTGSSNSWKRDTIAGRIDADAENIGFGCFVKQTGSLLLDDIKLEIQAPGGEWETIMDVNGGFENDTAGNKPAYWFFRPNEKVFSVKITAQQAATGKQALLLERNMGFPDMQKTTALFALNVQPGAVITKNIGSGLSITMPVALWGNGEQTWPLTDTLQAGQLNLARMQALPQQLTGDDRYVRLAGVIITWNVFQHFHPYYNEWVTDWDKDLRQALRDCYADKSAADFGGTLKTLTAKMRDGHTGVRGAAQGEQRFAPLKWEWMENKLVVTRVLSPDVPLAVGDVITAINGRPAKERIDQETKSVSAGSPGALVEKALLQLAAGPKDSVMALAVAEKGKVDVRFDYPAMQYYRTDPQPEPYRKIDAATAYVNISQMPWEEMSKKLPELAKMPVVIFDLRGYPNGNNGFMLVSHLLKQPETVKWMRKQMLTLPDHENTGWAPVGWDMKPQQPRIAGKVYFLTNGDAISYAESVMGYIKGQRLGTIVGEPTAGANGDVNTVILPGGYAFTFTGLKVTNHDGSQHFMKGVAPDVPVYKTIKGIRENRDEVLEKAVELSRGATLSLPAGGK